MPGVQWNYECGGKELLAGWNNFYLVFGIQIYEFIDWCAHFIRFPSAAAESTVAFHSETERAANLL